MGFFCAVVHSCFQLSFQSFVLFICSGAFGHVFSCWGFQLLHEQMLICPWAHSFVQASVLVFVGSFRHVYSCLLAQLHIRSVGHSFIGRCVHCLFQWWVSWSLIHPIVCYACLCCALVHLFCQVAPSLIGSFVNSGIHICSLAHACIHWIVPFWRAFWVCIMLCYVRGHFAMAVQSSQVGTAVPSAVSLHPGIHTGVQHTFHLRALLGMAVRIARWRLPAPYSSSMAVWAHVH